MSNNTGNIKPAEVLYNIFINTCLPVALGAIYAGYRDRAPLRTLRDKFFPPKNIKEAKYWLHGASVGEIKQLNMVADWLKNFGVSGREILISAQTYSGLENINHPRKLFMPADYSWLMAPLSRRLSVEQLIVMETELWPNLYRYHAGKVSIFNGKIKEKTYSKYRWIKPLVSAVLSRCQGVLARTASDGERFRRLGCSPDILQVTGSLKWLELLEVPSELESGPRFPSKREVLVAGSTHPGEEELALQLLEEDRRALYLAPRHLERIEEVQHYLETEDYDWCLWSQGAGEFDGDVILVDEMGLLAGLYGRGDVAFVGGSWASEVGGHNLLEPAVHGLPVVTGPYLANVREISRTLAAEGLLFKTEDRENWTSKVDKALALSEGKRDNIRNRLKEKAETVKQHYFSYLHGLVDSE